MTVSKTPRPPVPNYRSVRQLLVKKFQTCSHGSSPPWFCIIAGILLGLQLGLAQEPPYLTTRSPLTLLSSNDGEFAQIFLRKPDGTTDWELKTKDSFTVIHLGPDHPPIIKTVYDTVPATIHGTPTMAMSKDGRYGVIANHSRRMAKLLKLKLPSVPRTNADLTPEMLKEPKMTAPYADMLSLIDLSRNDYPVIHRVLLDELPTHILPHPDGKRFIVGGSKHFFVFKIVDEQLVEVSRSPQPHGVPCFWIHPRGDHLIATQALFDTPFVPGRPSSVTKPTTVQWYAIEGNQIQHLNELKVKPGLPTKLLNSSMILRISLDGRLALICQRATGNGRDFCDVLIADLTLEKPMINDVIKQVSDGLESFAFHPNQKMAVATGLNPNHNCIAVLDIASKPARLLYTLDAKGIGQGIEFSPDGDRLFVGSAIAGRIEVFDVIGDFELRKNPKFLNVGFGHNSLTIGPRYMQKKSTSPN